MKTQRGGLLFALLFALAAVVGAGEKEQPKLDLGPNASLRGYRPFPDDSPWNTPVDKLPVDAKSQTFIKSIGANKPLHPDFGAPYESAPLGISYVVVEGTQPKVPLTFEYADESALSASLGSSVPAMIRTRATIRSTS